MDDDLRKDVRELTEGVVSYARHLGSGEDSTSTLEVLMLTLGTEYADRIDDPVGSAAPRTAASRAPPRTT